MPSLRRAFSPATGIALLALFLSLNGTSFAAKGLSLVTGAQIRDSSVTGKDVRNGSLDARDLSPAARAALAGAAGPAGPRGPAGTDATGSPAGLLSALAGADGAGSGLDADLLDGLSSNAFQRPGDAVGGSLTGTAAAPSIAVQAVVTSALKDGAVTPPKLGYAPAVRVLTTASAAIAGSDPYGDWPVRFAGELYDASATHSISGNTWDITIPLAGIYQTSCSVPFGGGGSGALQGVRIAATGGTAEIVGTSETVPAGNGPITLSVTGDVALAAGQTLQCQARTEAAGGVVIPAGATFSARWVGVAS